MSSHTSRKARTRTLIQIGGLVEKAGLLPFFRIELGEDLQMDLQGLEKASTLMGLFIKAKEELYDRQEPFFDELKDTGEKAIKYNLFIRE